MEAVCSSKISASTHKATGCHSLEKHSLNHVFCQNVVVDSHNVVICQLLTASVDREGIDRIGRVIIETAMNSVPYSHNLSLCRYILNILIYLCSCVTVVLTYLRYISEQSHLTMTVVEVGACCVYATHSELQLLCCIHSVLLIVLHVISIFSFTKMILYVCSQLCYLMKLSRALVE